MTAAPGAPPDAAVTWRAGRPVDVRRTLAPLVRGPRDPTHRTVDGTFWRTALTPDGPATLALRPAAPGEVHARAWGPGARWAVDGVSDLLGARDDVAGFTPRHPLLERAFRLHPGLRIPRTGLVWDALLPAVLEQKVTGLEARRSFRELVCRHGSPAPGPAPPGMRVIPAPADVRALASWDWHLAGVDHRRAGTLRAAATVAARLEESLDLPPDAAMARLRVVPGIGAWTAAEVAQRAHGDADAVSVGDYHIPSLVGWALLGTDLDDAGMLDLLEVYRPHRHRVVRLIEVARAPRPPRRAPRAPVRDYRSV